MEYSFYTRTNPQVEKAFDEHRYCNGTLCNNKGIEDATFLNQVESEDVKRRIRTIWENVPKTKLNVALLKRIHKYLFSTIYSWAGNLRDGDATQEFEKFFIPGLSIKHDDPQSIYFDLKSFIKEMKKSD